MGGSDSFWNYLSNKPSLGAPVPELGELHFQQAHLVIFSTAWPGFSQNLLIGSKFCLINIECLPLTFLGKLLVLP